MGRCAVVTGGTRGIGAACAARLDAEGATVVIVGRDEGPAQEVLSRLERPGHFVAADLADPEQVTWVAHRAGELLGEVDVLVNAAGTVRQRRSANVTAADVRAGLAVNLDAVVLLSTQIGRSMVERRRGSIVNVTSVAATGAAPFQVVYAASKAGAEAATRSLAAEWAPFGVRVNAVSPGVVRTDMTKPAWDADAARVATEAKVPLGRIGDVADIAHAVAFLASDEAGYITGQTLVVDGGLLGSYDLTGRRP